MLPLAGALKSGGARAPEGDRPRLSLAERAPHAGYVSTAERGGEGRLCTDLHPLSLRQVGSGHRSLPVLADL